MINNIPDKYKNESGIYIIKNSVNSKVYIGSAVCFARRFRQHLHDLKKNQHKSIHLQNHVNKYGIESLSFNLLEVCAKALLLQAEQYYLDTYQPFESKGFNTSKVAGATNGYKHTEEAKKLMSERKKGLKMSEEFKELKRLAWLGKKHTPEALKNMRKAQANKTYGEEARKNMSLAHIGNKHTEEQKAKIADANRGKGHNKTGVIVLNTETGIYYSNIKAAAESTTYVMNSGLQRRLSGKFINKTPFVIA